MAATLWTRCDIPKAAIHPDHHHGSSSEIASTKESNGRTSHLYTIYGPGEIEIYRHAQLRNDVRDAKLKVWYPGRWADPSPCAEFRLSWRCRQRKKHDVRHMGAWKFHSNARILSASLDGEEDFNGSDVNWKSTDRTIQNELVYEHDVHFSLPAKAKTDTEITSQDSCKSVLVLKLDTRLVTAENDSIEHNNASTNKEEPSSTANEGHLYAPPCICLFPTTDEEQIQFDSWEWRPVDGEQDVDPQWNRIYSCWTSEMPFERCDQQSSLLRKQSTSASTYASDINESTWVFPHQMTVHNIETIQPVEIPLSTSQNFNESNEVQHLYDFGKEVFGNVQITIASECAQSLSEIKPTVKLRVGETLGEAVNDDDEHFEQSTELVSASDSDRGKIVFRSAHLLAFRFGRIIFDGSDATAHQLLVECHSRCPRLTYNGGITSTQNHNYNSAQTEQDTALDDKIWKTAAYTLQQCIHHSFIVDGIKRDRLPWTGDLAVSIMANAYSFADAECIRFTLAVFGRCGEDRLIKDSQFSKNARRSSDAEQKAMMKESHVNGIVDFSLWYIISHWLYQRYFGDDTFLWQEWSMIARRLLSLVKYCTDNDSGFLFTCDDDWVFIDWSDTVDKNSALQTLWWWALDCSILLAKMLMDKPDCDLSFLDSISEAQTQLERSLVNLLADSQQPYSRHAHILGVLSGLYSRLVDNASSKEWWNPDTSDDHWQQLVRVRRFEDQARNALLGDQLEQVGTPFMKHLECLAISRLGERSFGLDRVRKYWGGMLKAGATTFFEAFSEDESTGDIAKFYDRPFGRSLCHAWAAGPCALLPEIMLGLQPISDGWKVFLCDPLDDCPATLSCSVKTKHGAIEVNLSSTSLEVTVPKNCTMILMERRYGAGLCCVPRDKLLSSESIRQWSKRFRYWSHHPKHVIPPNPDIPGYDNIKMTDVPTVYQIPGDEKYYMTFVGFDGSCYQSFVAETADFISWNNFRLAMACGKGDEGGVVLGAYLYQSYDVKNTPMLKRVDGKFYSLYGAYSKKGGYEIDPGHHGLASSKDGLYWEREMSESVMSIFGPGTVGSWERDSIYQPWLVQHSGMFYNFYNAKEMPQWVEQIGVATSTDLREWKRHDGNPILCTTSHGYDTQFCSDAKVFFDSGVEHWVMFYYGVGKGGASVMIAYSKDLMHWMRDSLPLYRFGDNPSGLDKSYSHKTSIVYSNGRWYMYYCAVGDNGRGIGLITS